MTLPPASVVDHDALVAWLASREAQLRAEITAAQHQGADTHDVVDLKDLAAKSTSAYLSGLEAERDLAELQGIAEAREQITRGRYGICVDCESEIDVERLRAQPAAVRCLACQSLTEQHKA